MGIEQKINNKLNQFPALKKMVKRYYCDLHPRWSKDSRIICFDAAFESFEGYMLQRF